MYTSNIISTLIGTGPDASSNLFEVQFTFKKINDSGSDIASLVYRTTSFQSPQKVNTTVNVEYLNMSFPILSSGVDINRTLNLNVRLDANYDLVKFLNSRLCIDENGNFTKDDTKACTIVVNALKMPDNNYTWVRQNVTVNGWETANISRTSGANMPIEHTWKFANCYLVECPSLSYDYNSSNPLTQQIKFIYDIMDES